VKFKEIEEKIKELVPSACGLQKIEPRGPWIVVYVSDITPFYEDEELIKKIASTVKKKILLRIDQDRLLSPEEAKRKILELVPKEAGIERISFSQVFSEVYIEAAKPGLVIQ